MTSPGLWPEGRRFAFSVFDDTDAATIENVKPVYDFLRDLGFRVTKSVWPLAGSEPAAVVGGSTCAEPDYLRWVLALQRDGFEIGYHNATFHSSLRAATIRGLDRFLELFGHDPSAMANHTSCRDGIYWGEHRVSGIRRTIYNILTRYRHRGWFRGHVEGDPYFWGDLCKRRIQYVRNFVFPDINTLKACPGMPYHDPQRPFVNHWFASSEGDRLQSFVHTLAEANQDRLEAEGGACIMYVHFSKGFYEQGALDRTFVSLMTRLSRKNGWFVPTSTILDHLRSRNGGGPLMASDRVRLETRWLLHKLRVGTT